MAGVTTPRDASTRVRVPSRQLNRDNYEMSQSNDDSEEINSSSSSSDDPETAILYDDEKIGMFASLGDLFQFLSYFIYLINYRVDKINY